MLGTKFIVFNHPPQRLAGALSVEVKMPNGSRSRGLGSGAMDYDFRFRVQKALPSTDVYANLGFTILGEPTVGGVRQPRKNRWFYSLAVEQRVSRRWKVLGEVYGNTPEEPGAFHRFAFSVGFKYRASRNQQWLFSIGRSLREDAKGGPRLRIWFGTRYDF